MLRILPVRGYISRAEVSFYGALREDRQCDTNMGARSPKDATRPLLVLPDYRGVTGVLSSAIVLVLVCALLWTTYIQFSKRYFDLLHSLRRREIQ